MDNEGSLEGLALSYFVLSVLGQGFCGSDFTDHQISSNLYLKDLIVKQTSFVLCHFCAYSAGISAAQLFRLGKLFNLCKLPCGWDMLKGLYCNVGILKQNCFGDKMRSIGHFTCQCS